MPNLEAEAVIKAVYPNLRALAGCLLRKERREHTLQRTALVHETVLRLFGKQKIRIDDPKNFLALAAHQMRRILIDYARMHQSKKRGGEFLRVPLFESEHCLTRNETDFLDLNNALLRLQILDRRAVQVVELKFFSGCTNKEAAAILGVSDATIEAIWLHARLWLHRELNPTLKAKQLASETVQLTLCRSSTHPTV